MRGKCIQKYNDVDPNYQFFLSAATNRNSGLYYQYYIDKHFACIMQRKIIKAIQNRQYYSQYHWHCHRYFSRDCYCLIIPRCK